MGGPVALLAPPAPDMVYDAIGGLNTTPNNFVDAGGGFTLWFKPDGQEEYVIGDVASWAAFHQWVGWGEASAGHYYCTELGNGVAYSGTSLPSNVLEVE